VICIPEYVRQFVRRKGAPPDRADVEAIARGQIALEDEARRAGHELVIEDTDLLSTVVYSRHYYGDCPSWIEAEMVRRVPDLYLLAGIEVPWIPDGDQRDRGQMREEMQALFRQALVEIEALVIEVHGPLEKRLRDGLRQIDSL
jgi:nicotinamide riboside kinase